MDETTGDPGPSESETSSASWWSSGFTERLQSVSLGPPEENLSTRDSACSRKQDQLSPLAASQILWETGAFSGVIPEGFYSVLPETKLKELFHNVPSIDELYSMGLEGFKADVILVDSERDKKLSKLKNFIMTLVKGLHSIPTSMIRKIAGVGLPNDSVGCFDQSKHMSVIVELNSVEMLVDLMKFPGQLIPFSNKTLIMYHISPTDESDSAENDSRDSPSLEPNSPLYGLCEKIDSEGGDHDDNSSHGFSYRRNEGIPSASGTHLCNILLHPMGATDSKLSVSHSEPNIANAFWRRSCRKVTVEQRTASSSPEHPLFRARGRSMLGGNRQTFAEDDSITTSRSDGASTSEPRRIRIRSISITPEISDDIVRGLMYIHRMKIVHRDLKSANCLVNKHWTVKICDLGLSRMVVDAPMRDSSSAGTPEWMAPELIRNEPFTEKCDVFSFGVIMWELCTLKRPWDGIPAMQVIYTVAQEGTRLEIPEGPLGKLISDCWAEPDQRPGCEEILSRLVECEYTLLMPLCT